MQPTNRPLELPIDTTGEIAHYRISDVSSVWSYAVTIHLDATEAASYRLEFGGPTGDGEVRWFEAGSDFEFADMTSFERGWRQSESRLRLVVTSAASSGATADVLVSRGR